MDQCLLMDNDISSDFNSEVIWDSNRDLFEIYFKKEIMDNKYHLAIITMNDESLPLEKALDYLKYR